MVQYSLKVTDNSPEKKFGSAFDQIITGEEVTDLFIKIHEYVCGSDYNNHILNLCIKSPENEINLSWQQYITEGFEIDGVRYTKDEDSCNTGNYWY